MDHFTNREYITFFVQKTFKVNLIGHIKIIKKSVMTLLMRQLCAAFSKNTYRCSLNITIGLLEKLFVDVFISFFSELHDQDVKSYKTLCSTGFKSEPNCTEYKILFY